MIIAAILVIAFGWVSADPIISVVIGLLILASSWGLVTRVFHVLLEGTCWTITSNDEAFTAHVLVDPSYEGDMDALIAGIQDLAHHKYSIGHVTIQAEQSLESCTENHHVGHLAFTARPERKRGASVRAMLRL